MSTMAFQITDVSIDYSAICSGTDQRKHQSSSSLAFVRGIRRWPVNSSHKGPVTRKMFPFDNIIMLINHYISRAIEITVKQPWCNKISNITILYGLQVPAWKQFW